MKNINEFELEREKVTFAEWWSQVLDGSPEDFKPEDADHVSIVYTGYYNWCWWREIEPQTKEEVQAWIREKCNG